MSRKPAVVISAVLAPLFSSTVLIAMVEPCSSSSMAAMSQPASRSAVAAPSVGSGGTVRVFDATMAPSCKATRSVKVPPMSMPTMLIFTSPRWGEVGARSAPGEGNSAYRKSWSPSPNPLSVGERELSAFAAATFFQCNTTSELHRHELVGIEAARLGNGRENPELLERVADHLDRLRVPGAVGREARHLRVVDFCDHARADVERPRLGLDGDVPVRTHERDGPEPSAQEAPEQLGSVGDHVVGREDHMGVEILHDAAEQQQVAGPAFLLELVAVGGFLHGAVELAAIQGCKPRLDRAERHDLDAVAAPALLA